MGNVRQAQVIRLKQRAERDRFGRSLAQAVKARRGLDRPGRSEPSGGRAWLNGHEVGGTPERYRHLSRSYD